MKIGTAFLLSVLVAACAANEPRTHWALPADASYEALVPPASVAVSAVDPAPALATTAPMTFASLAPATAASPLQTVIEEHRHEEPFAARISLLLGMRTFDEDDFEPVEDQPVLGLDFSFEPPGSFIGFEVGLMGSAEDDEVLGTDLESRVGEIYAGVRKTFGDRARGLHPYIGGGVSAINVDVEIDGVGSDDDTSIAGYVHGGILAKVGGSFFVGADARGLFGTDIELEGVEVDADYLQLAFVLGWAF